MADHGMRVSLSGEDAKTADDKTTSFSSKFSSLKIFKRGYLTITTNGSGVGTGSVVHGLGYSPTFYVWRNDTADFSFLDATTYSNTLTPVLGTSTPWINFHQESDAYTDETSLHIRIEGANSTDYVFVYYIFVDQAEFNDANGFITTDTHGAKVSKPDFNVKNAKEQEIEFNSRYRSMKYFRELTTDYGGLNLPAIAGDTFDPNPEEGTYVDFFHGLAYPPFYLVYSQETGDDNREAVPVGFRGNLFGSSDFSLTSWCDKSRIRVTFYRKAHFTGIGSSFNTSFSDSTIDIKVFILAEDMGLE